jgi:hypothetical protein
LGYFPSDINDDISALSARYPTSTGTCSTETTFRTPDGARNFCRVRSYLSTARKQGHSLLYSLERALAGKPLTFRQPEAEPV